MGGPIAIWSYIHGRNLLFETFLYFTNATMVLQDVTMFFSAHGGQIHWSANFSNSEVPLWQGLAIPQAWSLGIELSFYLLAPFLLNLLSRWLILGACCSLVVKVIAIKALHHGDPWTYRFFPFELGYFLLGALAFRYRPRFDISTRKYLVYRVVIGFTVFRLPVHLAYIFYPVLLACALPLLFHVTAGIKADRLLGELSYPFYIFHLFAIRVAANLTRLWWHSAWVALVLTLVLSAIGLALEVRFIEP